MEEGVDRLLENASAQFEAAIAAEEDAAANDLALSLRQGSELGVLLSRSAWLLRRVGGGTALLTHVGSDLVRAASGSGEVDLVVPLTRARLVAGEGSPPAITNETFLATLRHQVRRRAEVRVWLDAEPLDGRLTLVTESHLILGRPAGEAVLPLGDVREVQFVV